MIEKKTSKVWITVPSEKKCRTLKLFPSTHSFVASCKCCQQRPQSIKVIVVYLQCSLPFFVLVNLLARTVFENIFFSFFLHKFNAIYRQKEEEEEETSAQSAQSLGVHIDEALTWATHTKETSKKLTSAIGACDTVCSSVDPPNNVQLFYPAVLWLLQQCLDSERALKLQKLQNRSARMTIVSRLTLPFRPPTARASLIQAFLFCQRRLWFLLLGFLGVIPYSQVANLLIMATLQHQPPTDVVLMFNTGRLLVTVLAFLWTRT